MSCVCKGLTTPSLRYTPRQNHRTVGPRVYSTANFIARTKVSLVHLWMREAFPFSQLFFSQPTVHSRVLAERVGIVTLRCNV